MRFLRCGASTAGLVALVAGGIYANTLANGFVVDDLRQIVDNEWITSIAHLPEIFSRGVWDFEGRVSSYYRPLMYAFYMATWYVVGAAPWGYHLVNVLLHVGASMLVLSLAQRLLGPEAMRARSPWLGAPFVAALVFAVHPIHTEAVAWVAGITDVAMTFFCLLSLWLYLEAREGGRPTLALAAVSFFLATLCKETAMVLPAILIVYEALLRSGQWDTRRVGVRLLPFVGAVVLYMALRVHALGGFAPTAGGVPLPPARYAATVVVLFEGYVEKLVFPFNLNFWSAFSPPESFASPAAAQALVVLGAAVVVAWLAARHSRVALFGVALILIPLLPAFHLSALNQGLENALAERYLYFPSVGLALLAGMALDRLRVRTSPQLVIPVVVFAVVAGLLAVGTVRRNAVWRDGLTLWIDVVSKSPGSAVARMNYGMALIHAGRRSEGERELALAVRMRPDLVDRELAKGAAFAAQGLHKKAILTYHLALALDPRSAPAHFALGVAYEGKGWRDAAIGEYRTALALRPELAQAHNNLGVLYAQSGLMDLALQHFEVAARLRPDDADFRANLERARGRR